MDNEIKDLKKVLKVNINFLFDEKKLSSLFADVFNGNVGKTNLLMSAFKSGIIKNIINSSNNENSKKFIVKLINEWNLDYEKANEAINCWNEILDEEILILYVKKIQCDNTEYQNKNLNFDRIIENRNNFFGNTNELDVGVSSKLFEEKLNNGSNGFINNNLNNKGVLGKVNNGISISKKINTNTYNSVVKNSFINNTNVFNVNSIVKTKNNLHTIDNLKDKIENAMLVKDSLNKNELISIVFGNIEWFVLDKKDNKALLISKYIVECKPYNDKLEDITWENCSLRKWLNNDFLNSYFSIDEQKIIMLKSISNKDSKKYGTIGGNNTKDKIFLLSIDEAKKYFKNDNMRATNGTNYANKVNNGSLYVGYDGNSSFWLRSIGRSQKSAAGVTSDGSICDYGFPVDNCIRGVRPAMWVRY